MTDQIKTETVSVVYLEPNDIFVGFSGEQYTVVSVDTDSDPVAVTVVFSHASKPGETASMTFSNHLTPMQILAK